MPKPYLSTYLWPGSQVTFWVPGNEINKVLKGINYSSPCSPIL